MNKFTSATLMLVACLGMGCEKSARSFSLLADDAVFQQSPLVVQRKVDILWVVDNSGSMETSQSNLASSFQSFIERFQGLNYDFRMAVTTSDAYRAQYNGNTALVRFRDGDITQPTGSGVRVMSNETPDLNNVFITNILQGTSGSGDERAFQSFKAALEYSENSDFRREDAFLAIIIVSDEDDFSADTGSFLLDNYNDPRLLPVDTYVQFLQDFTQSGRTATEPRNFSVSTISIPDSACHTQLTDNWPGRKIGVRYHEIVEKTGGEETSLCSNFGESLELISDSIVALTSVFYLDREPDPSTILVHVNGVKIPNDPDHGWTYHPEDLSIRFSKDTTPGNGASISIAFDPKTIKL
ncbi:MAG: hypothetical protein AB7H97_03510 [Pseudobdellovibrionaceae bacterium]